MSDKLTALREFLLGQELDGFLLPANDEFMGEYVPDCARRLEWLTGFTGSAGFAVVLASPSPLAGEGRGGGRSNEGNAAGLPPSLTLPRKGGVRLNDLPRKGGGDKQEIVSKAAFFTDGRYTLQAEAEVKDLEIHNSGTLSPEAWLERQAGPDARIGYDPRLHTLQGVKRFTAKAILVPLSSNPVDALWKDRPAPPASEAELQPAHYTGESSAQKRARVATEVAAKGADALLLTAPDSICWLLNMRGNDVPFTPFILCYSLLAKSGQVTLYLDEARVPQILRDEWGDGVTLKPPSAMAADLAACAGQHVLYDPAQSGVWFHQQLSQAGAVIVEASDPCQLPKACKNAAELEGAREAHRIDGLAVTRFLYWLEEALAHGEALTEMIVAARLEQFRAESPLYLGPSFTTISGSGPNGAIVHYRVTQASNRPLDRDSLLLVDSGGQYAGGTTDITRTVALGTPSAEMRERFTLVLKGHIALARARFPQGTGGTQLDALARQFLWQAGLDYDHGTGHGVGSRLSVHEGPQRVSKRGGDQPLLPGMILSNEPGYYKTGEYGIRVENLVEVKQEGEKGFLGFDTLTLVPMDLKLVNEQLLSGAEREWLKAYHRKVYQTHSAALTPAQARWLEAFVTKL